LLREHWDFTWNRRGLGERVKRTVGGARATPARVRRLQRVIPGPDGLVTPALSTSSEAIEDRFLAELLSDRELGTWTLSPWAINQLAALVRDRRPRLALEFGSGVSTVSLAHLMKQARDDLQPPWVISVEQDAEHVQATSDLLAQAGLGHAGVVLHAPLTQKDSFGATRSAYAVEHEVIATHIRDRTVDLVTVDGPAAEDGARVTSLEAGMKHLSEPALVILDDALRDGELEAARHWLSAGWLASAHYLTPEKGMLIAVAQPDPAQRFSRNMPQA
jgi:predicted O-methyltransferase YrrM